MNIWGYVVTETPLATEMALREKLPEHYWLTVNSILVAFGQGTCKSQRPHCDRCLLNGDCPKIGVTPRKIPGRKVSTNGHLKMISWNVNGLRAIEKKGFIDLVNELDGDLLALQEIKAEVEPSLTILLVMVWMLWTAEQRCSLCILHLRLLRKQIFITHTKLIWLFTNTYR